MKKTLRSEIGRLSLVAGVGLSKRLKYLIINHSFDSTFAVFHHFDSK